jgi:hypothetical protein
MMMLQRHNKDKVCMTNDNQTLVILFLTFDVGIIVVFKKYFLFKNILK